MLQFQYMAPWVPAFRNALEGEKTANQGKPPFTTFMLATVDSQGYPHNRTLVFRGFLFNDKSNSVITFTTDKRLSKYAELQANDKFEAVFYFERLKKQFRFRGRARIIDDSTKPTVDLSSIQPKTILENNVYQSSDDEDDEDDDEILSINITSSRSSLEPTKPPTTDTHSHPINYPLISPTVAGQIQQDLKKNNSSYTTLDDLSHFEFTPPTDCEWDAEISRQWDALLPSLRSSFRKPAPSSELTDEKQNQIDKIGRGVDGQKEESGRKNFAVVALFVDYVDYVELEKDRRYIYSKDDHHYWSEHEVCP